MKVDFIIIFILFINFILFGLIRLSCILVEVYATYVAERHRCIIINPALITPTFCKGFVCFGTRRTEKCGHTQLTGSSSHTHILDCVVSVFLLEC